MQSYTAEERSIALPRRCLIPSVIRPTPTAEAITSSAASESWQSREIAFASPINSTSGMSFRPRISIVLSFNQTDLDCGADLETLQNFTSVEADFYQGLSEHYAKVISDWYEASLTDR